MNTLKCFYITNEERSVFQRFYFKRLVKVEKIKHKALEKGK